LLSRLTREHVTVVLSGEGGDEVHGGYRAYERGLGKSGALDWIHFPGSPVPALFRSLPGALRRGRIAKALAHPPGRRYASQSKQFREETQARLYTPGFRAARREVMRDHGERFHDACDAAGRVDRLLAVDTQLWLPDDLLTKVDRATMAYSLEARVPHLDHEVVEFCAALPVDLKVRPGATKYLLKKVAERYLPTEVVHRKKQGFAMPLDEWLRDGLRDLMEDSLGDGGLARRGLLKPAQIRQLVANQLDRRKDRGRRIWTLMMLEQWFRRHAPDWRLSP
ncbi:MAG: asparagine synthase C-terminal domain-containing protein, partial [Planctomycetota bacterium]